MNYVELTYNPYKRTSRILINNKTISSYGEIANFLREPFSVWAGKILDAIARELNDDFELEFISTDIETAILKKIAENHDCCKKFSAKNFIVQASILERITQYEKLDGHLENKHKKEYTIYGDSDDILSYVNNSFLKNANIKVEQDNKLSLTYGNFCELNYTLLLDTVSDSEDTECIYISKDQGKLLTWLNQGNSRNKLAILLGGNNEFCGTQNNSYVFESTEECLIELILSFIEYETVIPLFAEEWKTFLGRYAGNKNNSSIRIIDATEPVIYVLCNERYIEEGASCKIEVKSYPENIETPEVIFKISNESVIQYSSGVLYGVKAGNTLVEVYIAGTIEPIYQNNFTVIKRNKITQINIECSDYVIGENQHETLKYSFLPKDADNVDTISIISLNPDVVDVSAEGIITGIKVGKTRIRIYTDDVVSECDVEVKPYMTGIILSEDEVKMLVGGTRELNYKTRPLDVINPDVQYEVSNEKVIEFDGHFIKGKSFGNAQIKFFNSDKSVTKTCDVEVKSTLANDKTNFFKGLTVVAFIVSLICMMVSPAISIGVAFLGVVLGVCGIPYAISIAKDQFTHYGTQKKPDYAFCIVGVILNIIAIAIQLMWLYERGEFIW